MSENTSDLLEAALLCIGAAGILERRCDRALSYQGISFSEFRLLRALSAYRHGAPRIELAQQVGLTASAVTRALKPLEKLGLIESQRNARDARQSLTSLTSAGADYLREGEVAVRTALEQTRLAEFDAQELADWGARLGAVRGAGLRR
ncbi:MAG: MarR family transcriptional regulator [Pseudomonadota bacterium]